jgi:hypothetical protein
MAVSFVLNRAYPDAPFSALYLFGRKQDVGFQEDVGSSPRNRHHVRFWAADADPEGKLVDLAYWMARRRIDPARSHLWVGAGTRDTGFEFQAMTGQISHRVDRHPDPERDHIVAVLREARRIEGERYFEAGALVGSHFISDGRIARAVLLPTGGTG